MITVQPIAIAKSNSRFPDGTLRGALERELSQLAARANDRQRSGFSAYSSASSEPLRFGTNRGPMERHASRSLAPERGSATRSAFSITAKPETDFGNRSNHVDCYLPCVTHHRLREN